MKNRIVICDDDCMFAERLAEQLQEKMAGQDSDCDITCLYSGKELLERMESETWNVFFLDIMLQEYSGLKIAEQITVQMPEAILIFVTNQDNLVFQAIHSQPFRFLRKDKLDEELDEAVTALLWKRSREEKQLAVPHKGNILQISLIDITYLMSCKHYLYIQCRQERYEIRAKLNDYDWQLQDCGFARIHMSYLVNLRYVNRIQGNELTLEDGTILPISRSCAASFKRQYVEYYTKRFEHSHSSDFTE